MRSNVLTSESKTILPKVSVLILTYNHERFIEQAIESVLVQVADFDYEIVVGDDCSNDGTSGIVEALRQKYPDRIHIHRPELNVGMGRNFAFCLSRCCGEYIALLEGDDYWISPEKLQRQVDALDAHRDWVLNFHPVEVINVANSGASDILKETPAIIRTEDLLQENNIPTCSVMFRRNALKELPSWCLQTKILDWPLFVLLSHHGNAGMVPETMAAYRIHSSGLWSRKSQRERSEAIADLFTFFRRHLDKRFSALIRKRLIQAYAHIAFCQEEEGDLGAAMKANCQAMILNLRRGHEQKYHFLRLLAKIATPSFYSLVLRLQTKRTSSALPSAQTTVHIHPQIHT